MISELIGKTLVSIDKKGDDIIFNCTTGERYRMYHSQEYYETVVIDDICGDLNDLIESPILIAEEVVESVDDPDKNDSHTWTFYKIATIKGHVDIRWYGESDGFYSERVDFKRID